MRSLFEEEKQLLMRFAEKLDRNERSQLLADAACATAQTVAPDGSRIKFQLDGYQRPPYQGQHTYGAEGKMLDSDFAELSVVLYADENGRLFELEFIRWDSSDLLGPRWNTLEVF